MLNEIQLLGNALYADSRNSAHDDIIAATVIEGCLSAADLRRAVKFVEEQEASNAHSEHRFVIPGDPPISKRPRATSMRNKAGQHTGIRMFAADAAEQRTAREDLRRLVPESYIPYAGEVELGLAIYRPMLSSWAPYKRLLAELGYIRPESKPDYDNFAKILTDAMRGVLFIDDGQIVVGHVTLSYSARPRLEIVVSGRQRRMNK